MRRIFVGVIALVFMPLVQGSNLYGQSATKGSILAQENYPYSNAGQWVPVYLDLTNQDSVREFVDLQLDIYQKPNGDSYGDWCYDTVRANSGINVQDSMIWVPVHATTPDVRVLCFYRSQVPDTTSAYLQGLGCNNIYLRGHGNCAPVQGFWDPGWGTIEDSLYPADVGKTPSTPPYGAWNMVGTFPTETPYAASVVIVGEYSSLFHLSYPSTVKPYTGYEVKTTYDGAPKRIVHDTLIGTFTNCLGTFIYRTPIDGYSIYSKSHTVRFVSDTGRLQMLGRKVDSIIVRNLTASPMIVTDLTDKPPYANQYVVHWPASGFITVPPMDSCAILVDVSDNVLYDLYNTSTTMSDAILFHLRFPAIEGMVSDTTERVFLFDEPNVYCPNYLSNPPMLKAGIHPAGILFDCGHGSFLTPYRNYESESYTFYQPYYDDPHLTVSLSIPLPQSIPANAQLLDATTKNTCDPHNDYHTFMHWPRVRDRDGLRDTIDIEVVVVGSSATHTFAVAEPLHQSAAIWPNPATDFVNLKLQKAIVGDLTICDVLGRTVFEQQINGATAKINLSNLPAGVYELRIPKIGLVEELRVVR